MKLIIDINKEDYEYIRENKGMHYTSTTKICEAIFDGIPLPKGHGRLVDADHLRNVELLHNFHGNNINIVPYSDRRGYRLRDREVNEAIINAPTIIEADKGE